MQQTISSTNKCSVQIIRLGEVVQKTQLAKATLYRLIRNGKFPSGFKLADGGRATGWLLSDIEKFLTRRSVEGVGK